MEIVHNEILECYGFSHASVEIEKIGSGHINRTYLLSTADKKQFILQEINTTVFKKPENIADNVSQIAKYLKTNYPDYLFPAPLPTKTGETMATANGTFWRLLPYIDHTIALDALFEPMQAYEAAKQFGKLSRLLADFPVDSLSETIPGFHDLDFRFGQFKEALESTSDYLQETASKEISSVNHFAFINHYYQSILLRKDFPNRVMHHDTKISNVLLDKETFKGICIIDLDTLMPGKFISDLGDMMRTYLCAFDENETDLDKITIRIPYFQALINGYLSEMKDILTSTERELILFSGKYIIYMQAIRFLTDFLNGSKYYPIAYPNQNLDRAKNQLRLLRELFDGEKIFEDVIEDCLL